MRQEIRSCIKYFVNKAKENILSPKDRELLVRLKKYATKQENKLINVLLQLETETFIPSKHPDLLDIYNVIQTAPNVSENDILSIIRNLKQLSIAEVTKRLYNDVLLDRNTEQIKQEIFKLMKFTFEEDFSKIDKKKQALMQTHLLPTPVLFTGTFLDDFGGLQKDDFVIVGAGTGVGKTTWLLTIARNLMRLGKKVLYVDLEGQSNNSLMRMIKSIQNSSTDLDMWKQNPVCFVNTPIKNITGRETAEFIFQVWISNVLEDWREERLFLNIDTKEDEYPDILIVDYLQVLGNRLEISKLEPFCRSLYSFCSSKNIPLITASQLRKDMNKSQTDNKLPQLRDIYGFSNYIHTASKVALIIKPQSLTEHVRNKWKRLIPDAETRLAGFIIYTAKNRSEEGSSWALIVEYDYDTMTILNKQKYYVSSEKIDDLLGQYQMEFSNVDEILNRRENTIIVEGDENFFVWKEESFNEV